MAIDGPPPEEAGERRLVPRRRILRGQVRWTFARPRLVRGPVQETVIADFVDLSTVGAFVDAPARPVLPVGTVVDFRVDNHGGGRAAIRHVQDRGGVRVLYGVEFVDLDPSLREFFEAVVSGDETDVDWLGDFTS